VGLPANSGPWPLIQFRNHFSQTVGLLGRVISPSQGHYLNTGQHKHRITSYIHQTFELTIPASERAKTVHALGRAATVIGTLSISFFISIIRREIGSVKLNTDIMDTLEGEREK
jgi:hypothetical protein